MQKDGQFNENVLINSKIFAQVVIDSIESHCTGWGGEDDSYCSQLWWQLVLSSNTLKEARQNNVKSVRYVKRENVNIIVDGKSSTLRCV